MTSTCFHLEALDEGLGSGELHDSSSASGLSDCGHEKPLAAGEGRRSARRATRRAGRYVTTTRMVGGGDIERRDRSTRSADPVASRSVRPAQVRPRGRRSARRWWARAPTWAPRTTRAPACAPCSRSTGTNLPGLADSADRACGTPSSSCSPASRSARSLPEPSRRPCRRWLTAAVVFALARRSWPVRCSGSGSRSRSCARSKPNGAVSIEARRRERHDHASPGVRCPPRRAPSTWPTARQSVLEIVRRAPRHACSRTRGPSCCSPTRATRTWSASSVASPTGEPAGCSVDSPHHCPAVGRGQTTVYANDDELDSCPRLAGPCVRLVLRRVRSRDGDGTRRPECSTQSTSPNERARRRAAAFARNALASRRRTLRALLRAMHRTSLQAATDALTGLANRRTLEEAVRELFEQGQDFSLAVVDLDNFKLLNDTHGHEAGDRALRLFSRTMRDAVRPERSLSLATAAKSSSSCSTAPAIIDAMHAPRTRPPPLWPSGSRPARPRCSPRASASCTRRTPTASMSSSREPIKRCSRRSAPVVTGSRSRATTNRSAMRPTSPRLLAELGNTAN